MFGLLPFEPLDVRLVRRDVQGAVCRIDDHAGACAGRFFDEFARRVVHRHGGALPCLAVVGRQLRRGKERVGRWFAAVVHDHV